MISGSQSHVVLMIEKKETVVCIAQTSAEQVVLSLFC
jgi:hypothetical protein